MRPLTKETLEMARQGLLASEWCGFSKRDTVNQLCDLALKGLVPSTPWRPIDTAPKDGSEVLLRVELRAGIPGKQLVGHYMQGGHCIEDHPPIDAGWYFWNGCMFDRAAKPTHWMPLPEAE